MLTAGCLTDVQALFPDSVLTANAVVCGVCESGLSDSYKMIWALEDGVLTISGEGSMKYFDPGEEPWASYKMDIRRVVIEEGVTGIGAFAFRCYGSLTEVSIPQSVTDIGNAAFDGTPWMKAQQKKNPFVSVNGILINGESCKGNVTVPGNITSVTENAFYDNKELKRITISDGVTCITGAAFYRADSLESVTLPDSVKEIGYRAFDGCYYMKKIKMPNTMTYLGGSAFYGCASLQVIRVPEGLTSIESSTFCNAKKLRAVSMPKTLTRIESDAFSNCESLTLMAIPDNVQYIGSGVFEGCTNLKGVTVPETLKSIGEKAFFGCTSFTDFDIPANTTEIGGMAFRGTPWLAERQKVSLMVAVNGILIDGSGCQGSVTIPTGVDIIGEGAFEKCSEVTRVIIPKTTSEIRSRAFANCESLEEIIILNPICRIYTREDTVFTKWEPKFIFDGQIRGYQDSTAEILAKALDYSFLTIPTSQRGDYNGDRFFSISDAVLLARFSVQDSRLVSEQISHILNGEPDYDRDGFVTVNDLTALLKNLSK